MSSDWRVAAVAAVAVRRSTRLTTLREKVHLTTVRCYPSFTTLWDQAARRRKVSRNGYLRRVLAISIAADLDIPLIKVLGTIQHPSVPSQRSTGFKGFAVRFDDGEGIQTWCPHPGCTGAHLRVT